MRKVSLRMAKWLVELLGLDGLILVAFKGDKCKMVSYGDTAAYCKKLKPVLDQVAQVIDEEIQS